jgi:hypothetical protein
MISLFVKTLDFTAPILFLIFMGLFIAGFLAELGLIQRLAFLARPLVTVAHLPDVCASAFVLSLGSSIAANAMIAGQKNDGNLEESEVVLSAIMNSIPVYIREIFTYQIPIVIPALGLVVGGFYGLIFITTALVKISVVIFLGRLLFRERIGQFQKQTSVKVSSIGQAARKALRGQSRTFVRIAVLYFSMTMVVFALTERGAFEIFGVLPLADLFGLPTESIVPLTTYVASPILGISLLGPMIHSGGISEVQAMIVLMLGSLFMLPIFALRSLVPRHTAMFGFRLGLMVVIFSTGMSILVRLAFLLALLKFS